jgi:hypothetical protein
MSMDAFLTTLYVMVDDFCKTFLPVECRPGPKPSLCRSEAVTLAIFSQWARFRSETDFYRFARTNLRTAFPRLPDKSQLNRLMRRHSDATVAFFLHLVELLDARQCAFEVLDTSAVPTRDVKRRGAGWLPQVADVAWSNRRGWYEGLSLLVSANPDGAITGFCYSSGSTPDQTMAEGFFSLRKEPDPRLMSTGRMALGSYVGDKGFVGEDLHRRWFYEFGAEMICARKNNSLKPWPKEWRRWLAGIRQIVESIYDKLHNTFRLDRERPHHLTGFNARLAAKMALHNFCIWLNRQLGRPNLAFADLLGW